MVCTKYWNLIHAIVSLVAFLLYFRNLLYSKLVFRYPLLCSSISTLLILTVCRFRIFRPVFAAMEKFSRLCMVLKLFALGPRTNLHIFFFIHSNGVTKSFLEVEFLYISLMYKSGKLNFAELEIFKSAESTEWSCKVAV